eukprot:COSAG01_NODE_3619_length_5862_cov_3.208745_1_plen_394_part_00
MVAAAAAARRPPRARGPAAVRGDGRRVWHTLMTAIRYAAPYALLAVVLAMSLMDMPTPYHGRVPAPVDSESLARFPSFPANLTGPFAPNDVLASRAVRLLDGQIHGAESVAVSPDGTLLMLDKFGWLHRARQLSAAAGGADPTSSSSPDYELVGSHDEQPLYIGPGRPLGYHVVGNGTALLVCDSLKGLLRVDLAGTGAITILSNRAHVHAGPQLGATSRGGAINYANDLDVVEGVSSVSAVEAVYFSSSTAGPVGLHATGFYDTMRSFLLNMCCGDHTGRLLRYTPATGRTEELLSGLWYANGVTVAHDGDSVLVVETMGFRVVRYWLRGPRRGTTATLVDKLPGFPDGISRSSDGNYWVCLVAPLSPLLATLKLGAAFRHLLSVSDYTLYR